MKSSMRLYPKGYIFSDKSLVNLPDHYSQRKIVDKFFYGIDGNMELHLKEEKDRFIIIHGEFIHIGIDNQYTNQGVINHLFQSYFSDYDKFLDALDFIAGRYVVIIGDKENVRIYPDATNTRTTYFSLSSNIVSSHVYLINDQLKHEKEPFIRELNELTNGLMGTPFKNIKSIIPNFYVDFFTKKYYRFFPRTNNKYTEMNENDKLDLVERFLKGQLNYYFNEYENFIFSISGGGDSRFLLSLLKHDLDKIQFFTYATIDGEDYSSETGKMLTIDNKIVKQILSDIRINHKFIYFVENKVDVNDRIRNLLIRNTIGQHSSFLIPQVQKHFDLNNLQHIRGNVLEIGKTRYFSTKYKESNLEEFRRIFMKQYAKTKNESAKEYAANSFNHFISSLEYDENIFDYHLLDLYHWEVRMGRWHPEILNTHDIVFDTITPFNHRALIDISLSFPYEKRKDEYMFQEIINRNFPLLNFYGDNTVLNIYEQTRDKKYQ